MTEQEKDETLEAGKKGPEEKEEQKSEPENGTIIDNVLSSTRRRSKSPRTTTTRKAMVMQGLMLGKAKEPPPEYDEKSIYIKNLHPKTAKAELEENFASCGKIVRTTIAKDQMTGYSFGYVGSES